MYAASQDFHNAVAAGNHQMPLLIFKDAVFTERDIDVEYGLQFDDYFNIEEDIAIGQVASNELRFTLFNDDRLLNNYGFGEFTATLGVRIGTRSYQQFAPVKVITGYGEWTGYDDYPFLRKDGQAVSVQPGFSVKSLLAYDGKVWAFSSDGRYAVYNDATEANITSQNPVNAFMRKKSTKWIGCGYYYNPNTRILFIYSAGVQYRYEFVPLGIFIADRPNVPDQIRVQMTCHDRMVKFEKDMPDSDDLGIEYPATIKYLFERLCLYFNVPYRTSTFMNSTTVIETEPEVFSNSTARTVMGWIAEAAGSNARFDRDGYLVMDWIHSSGTTVSESGYSEFQPYWYETTTVNKLYNRDTSVGEDEIYGSGKNGYLIQNNPFLISSGGEE